MENFIRILVMPDNIPITALFLASIFFIWIAFKKALRNNHLTRTGQKEQILDDMED